MLGRYASPSSSAPQRRQVATRSRAGAAARGACCALGPLSLVRRRHHVLAAARGSGKRSGRERDAVLAALDADTPPPAPEIAWIFRQFCESLAADDRWFSSSTTSTGRSRHSSSWSSSSPTGAGADLNRLPGARGAARGQPSVPRGSENVERIVLDALSAEETDALLDGLGGAILGSDQRARIFETAEGNPFFLEQLLAVALEGGLAEQTLPETIQALLAARSSGLAQASELSSSAGRSYGGGSRHERRYRAPRTWCRSHRRRASRDARGRGFSGRRRTLSASAMSSFRTRCIARRRSAACGVARALRRSAHKTIAGPPISTNSSATTSSSVIPANRTWRVGSAHGTTCRGGDDGSARPESGR